MRALPLLLSALLAGMVEADYVLSTQSSQVGCAGTTTVSNVLYNGCVNVAANQYIAVTCTSSSAGTMKIYTDSACRTAAPIPPQPISPPLGCDRANNQNSVCVTGTFTKPTTGFVLSSYNQAFCPAPASGPIAIIFAATDTCLALPQTGNSAMVMCNAAGGTYTFKNFSLPNCQGTYTTPQSGNIGCTVVPASGGPSGGGQSSIQQVACTSGTAPGSSVTITPGPSSVPGATASRSPSPSPTRPSASASSTPTPTSTPMPSPASTPSNSPTNLPPGGSESNSPTNTPTNLPPGSTESNSPSSSDTPSTTTTLTASPSASDSYTMTLTATGTPTATVAPAAISPGVSPSATTSVTPTASLTPSATQTGSGTSSATPTRTLSPGATASASPSNTPTVSFTPTTTASASPSPTPSSSPTASLSRGASPSATPSATPSASITPSSTPTPTGSLSLGASPSITPTPTPAYWYQAAGQQAGSSPAPALTSGGVAGLVIGLLLLLAGVGLGAALFGRRGGAKKALGSSPAAVVVVTSPFAAAGAHYQIGLEMSSPGSPEYDQSAPLRGQAGPGQRAWSTGSGV